MNRTNQVTGNGIRTEDRERRQRSQEDHVETPETPRLVACLLLLTEDAAAILELIHELAKSSRGRSLVDFETPIKLPFRLASEDSWLDHPQAAEYLGVSKSTLYRYACQQRIECRKIAGRLEYRRSALTRFKDEQLRLPRNSSEAGSILPPALSSGK